MTAEVVIMNKLGMALAADSAITSGRDGVQKIYNSANKLFPLSKHHPIGIMVYGAASFMEVPWDIIIKSYRHYLGDKKYEKVSYYMEDLLDFLRHDERFSRGNLEHIIIYRTFSDLLKEIVQEVEEDIYNQNAPADEEIQDEKVTSLLTDCIQRYTKDFKNMEEEFLNIDYQSFKTKFNDVIQEIKEEVIVYEIPQDLDEKLCKLAFEAIKKDYFSIGSTGIVIAGYGESNIFPHLLTYRLEGFVFGQLKYKKLTEKRISYTTDDDGSTAAIMPFAQREMVDSFMGGIEPSMEDTIFEIVDQVLKRYYEQVEKNLGIEFTKKQVSDLKEMGKDVYSSMRDSLYDYQKKNYIAPLLGVVRSLPKEELAEMAEALVNLTSFKRRVTRATESVGPPIDVAVITKGDGFIWIKRKNYIDPTINERL